MKKKLLTTLLLIAISALMLPGFSRAASVPPTVLSYQGRLADGGGSLLGGAGTTYYFKFSLYDAVSSGNKVWPASAPTSYAQTVRQGVFAVNIGDTANGYPDSLTYDFARNPAVYLQVEVSSDNISFETLSPRQQVTSVPYALEAGAVVGTTTQSLFGTTTAAANSFVTAQATTSSIAALTLIGAAGQSANIFQIQNNSLQNVFSVTAAGALSLGTALTVPNGGTGSTTLGGLLTGNGAGALTAAAVSGPLAFSSNTLSISQASTGQGGYLSSTDFTTFNNKISSTSLSGGTGISYDSATGVITNTGALFSFPFTVNTGYNSTTTPLGLFASTTIGNGTGLGGLTVNGGATTTGNMYSPSGKILLGQADQSWIPNSSIYGAGWAYLVSGYISGNGAGMCWGTSSACFYGSGNSDATDYVAYKTNDQERVRILGNGNFGIGTTSPFATLSVAGDIFANGNITGSNITATGTLKVAGQTTLATSLNGLLKATAGVVSAAVAGTDYSNFAFPFTPTTNFGAAANSTSTALWFQNGLQASSTANLVDTNIFGKLGFIASSTVSNDILARFNGQKFLQSTTTSNGLLTLGYQAGNALLATSTVAGNIALGYQALLIATSSINNVAIGYQALANTKDFSNGGGTQSPSNSGSQNNAIGYKALTANTSGTSNNAQGNQALVNNTTGNYNAAIGGNALYGNTSGNGNVAIGINALAGNFSTYTFSDENVSIGGNSGYNIQGGSARNIFLGNQAGYNISTGDSNIVLGTYVDIPTGAGNGQLNLANVLYGTGLYNAANNGFNVSAVPVQNGNLGVGTSSPFAQFSVQAVAGSNNQTLFAIGSSTNAATTTLFTVSNTGTAYFAGSAAVGTQTQRQQLSVGDYLDLYSGVANSPVQASLRSSSAGNLIVNAKSGADLYLNFDAGNNIFFGNSSAIKSRVNTSGYLTLGSASDLAGSSYALYANGKPSYFSGDNTNAALFTNGSVGIGTTSPGTTFGVNGAAVIAGQVTGQYFSATSTLTASRFTYASTTALSAVTLCLTGDTCISAWPTGGGSSFGYPFALAGNSTSTLTQFGGGLTAYASSTIGNGTATSGLTINGGATTTLASYFGSTVGLGTTSPLGRLSVTSTGTGAGFAFVLANSNNVQLFNVQDNGNVGIGTTTPVAKLAVVGDTRIKETIDSATALVVENAAGVSTLAVSTLDTAANLLSVATSTGTSYFDITSGGNVGISTSTPWLTFAVSGTVGFSGLNVVSGANSSLCLDSNGQVVYNNNSDSCASSLRSTKHDIQDLALSDRNGAPRSGISTLALLQPVSFVYNNDLSSTTRYGFIAEDAAAVDSRLGSYDAQGNLSGIEDRSFIALAVQALKELIATVQGFSKRFTTQELCVADDSGAGTCITKAELDRLLAHAALDAAPADPGAPADTSGEASSTDPSGDPPPADEPPSDQATSTDPSPEEEPPAPQTP